MTAYRLKEILDKGADLALKEAMRFADEASKPCSTEYATAHAAAGLAMASLGAIFNTLIEECHD